MSKRTPGKWDVKRYEAIVMDQSTDSLARLRELLDILQRGKQSDSWKVGYVTSAIEYVIEEMESHQ